MASFPCCSCSHGGMLHTVTFEADDCTLCMRSLYAVARYALVDAPLTGEFAS